MKKMIRVLCGLCAGIYLIVSSYATEALAMSLNHSQLVVESYEIVEGKFEKSAECTIRIHVKNMDDSSSAMGGAVAIYSSYVFPVTEQTNQRVFGEIKPGESVFVDFDVNLDRIVSGPNLIEVKLNWTDENEVVYSNSVNISPVLLETVSFDVTAVKVPETIYGKKNTTISVSYENSGVEKLYHIYMVVDGDLLNGVQTIELDDLSAKEKNMTDCALELLNNGLNRISVAFKYEDRNGTTYVTEPIETYVTVTDKAYAAPIGQEKEIMAVITEYRVYIVAAVVAIVLWVPFIFGKISKKGGKKR